MTTSPDDSITFVAGHLGPAGSPWKADDCPWGRSVGRDRPFPPTPSAQPQDDLAALGRPLPIGGCSAPPDPPAGCALEDALRSCRGRSSGAWHAPLLQVARRATADHLPGTRLKPGLRRCARDCTVVVVVNSRSAVRQVVAPSSPDKTSKLLQPRVAIGTGQAEQDRSAHNAVHRYSPGRVKPHDAIRTVGERLRPPEIDPLGDPTWSVGNPLSIGSAQYKLALPARPALVGNDVEIVDGHVQQRPDASGEGGFATARAANVVGSFEGSTRRARDSSR